MTCMWPDLPAHGAGITVGGRCCGPSHSVVWNVRSVHDAKPGVTVADLDKYQRKKPGPSCTVGKFLASADPAVVELFHEITQLPDVVWARVEDHSAEDLGVHLSAGSLRRHINRRCTCD